MHFKIGLVRNRCDSDSHNFLDWQEFEESILCDNEVRSVEGGRINGFFASIFFRTMRIVGRGLGMTAPFEIPINAKEDVRIAVLGGPAFRRCPGFIFSGRKVAYLYDPTLPWVTEKQVVSFVEDTGISILFVSHPVFRDRLQPVLKKCQVHFIAEAVDPSKYKENETKSIDILAFGRKLESYHQALLQGLPAGISYHHEWLDTREDFITAMGSAKIVINFPRSVTDETMDVDALTMRYFQAFASNALVLGNCPSILVELFGYNPMIIVDSDDPCGQIKSILSNFSDYQALIEKNYEMLINHHTYSHRWGQMKAIINSEKFRR
jgi:hypothetical protein